MQAEPMHRVFRISATLVLFATLAAGPAGSAVAASAPEQEEWISLFNGRDLKGWTPKVTHHPVGDNFGKAFRVEGGLLKVRYDAYEKFDGQFGHLFYEKPFAYYRLVVEYRFVGEQAPGNPGAWALKNNGVMLHSQDPRTMQLDQAFPVSIEGQLLGGLGDGKPRPTMNVCSPGTDIVFQGRIYPDHCLESASPTFNGEEWVRVEFVVLGNALITHLVNGQKVLEYSLPQYEQHPAENYGTTPKPPGRLLEGGYIALQSESHPIDFRKIELLNLAGCMDPNASNYKRYYVKSVAESCVFPKGQPPADGKSTAQ
jgi:hypothetical protein